MTLSVKRLADRYNDDRVGVMIEMDKEALERLEWSFNFFKACAVPDGVCGACFDLLDEILFHARRKTP